MKLAILASCALAISMFGCAGSSEAPPGPTTTSTESNVEGYKVPTTVIYPLWDYNNSRLYVATCPISMPMPNNFDAAHEAADCVEITTAKIQIASVIIQEHGSGTGDTPGSVIVDDRPGGGGCIHVDLPGLGVGSELKILALVSDVPGAKGPRVAFATITTTSH